MTNTQYKPPTSGIRDFENRGLSTSIPKSNIVRIEVLDGNSRQRYLGAIQQTADVQLKTKFYQKISSSENNVFYGFMNDAGNTGLHITSQWQADDSGGALLNLARGIADTGVSAAGGVAGGLLAFVSGGSVLDGAKKGADIAKKGASFTARTSDQIGKIVNELAGVSGSSTGGGTVKTFKSVELQDYSVKCGWYLPEQYNLCTKSLKILYRMAYPKQLDKSNQQLWDDYVKGALSVLGTAVEVVIKGDSGGESNPAEKVAQKPPSADNNQQKAADDKGIIQKGFERYLDVNAALGKNFTFNPLPVRLCIGQFMDIEPLVITGINTQFSKETFVNADGRHLPIFVDTTINFKFWLTPAPNLNFVNVLGQEIFG